ncbi:hypothetical protein [Pedobacter sp.]|uniref:hypothetical protein n=1 Tax=Pedobacter sp. TaxID=1411316 RepID=UPI003BAD2093
MKIISSDFSLSFSTPLPPKRVAKVEKLLVCEKPAPLLFYLLYISTWISARKNHAPIKLFNRKVCFTGFSSFEKAVFVLRLKAFPPIYSDKYRRLKKISLLRKQVFTI